MDKQNTLESSAALPAPQPPEASPSQILSRDRLALDRLDPTPRERILYVRLPCNPIFPIGVVYLADHVHKLFPQADQHILDLGTSPPLDYYQTLEQTVIRYQPTLLVFSWRDIQIYAPVGDRGGNPLQYSFEFFYSPNPLIKARGAFGGARMLLSYYSELWRNEGLIRRGIKLAQRFNPHVRTVVGGGAVSVFYEQLQRRLPRGTIVSVGEGESLLEKLLRHESIDPERCYIAGETQPRPRLIHEAPAPLEKTACNYDYIETIWPDFGYYFQAQDFYIGVQTKRGCPHNCCYCVYTVIEGKQVRINPADEVVTEMQQLYRRGVRNFWFTDAQFIPARRFMEDAKDLLRKILAAGMTDIHWAAYIRADNLDPELAELMVQTGMNYFEIGITSGSQELVRKMRMGYNLRTVLQNCEDLKSAGFNAMVSVNYSFNVIDETVETIRQTLAYHRALERIFGADKVEPAIFFIGLQPHTLLEDYAFKNNIVSRSYNPLIQTPFNGRKLLWNPEPLGAFFGEVCLQAWRQNPTDFGREVMRILEERLGCAPLEEALSAPLEGKLLVEAGRS